MPRLPAVTVKEFRSWDPCWDAEELDAYLDQYVDEPWTALDVLALKDVSVDDRLWVVLRDKFLPRTVTQAFAYWCADRARLSAVAALRKAGVESEAKILEGLMPITDRASARAAEAAEAAAARAARATYRAAVWAASRATDAARAAVWAASREAVRAAVWAASREAAHKNERTVQIRHLTKLLKEHANA
mgnify:CR=1 FL=1